MAVSQELKDLKETTDETLGLARSVGHKIVSRPQVMGSSMDPMSDSSFQMLLNVRADLRSALASTEDAIKSVQEWRRS